MVAQSATSLSGSFCIFVFFSFYCFLWLSKFGCELAVRVQHQCGRVVTRVTNSSGFGWLAASKATFQTIIVADPFHATSHRQSCNLFVFFTYHLYGITALMTAALSVSLPVTKWMSESVKLACCQMASPGMSGEKGLCLSCVRCCHHKPMLMSQRCSGSVWHLSILPHCHVAQFSILTNADWQHILSVFECGCRRLTTFWDVNE